VSIQDRTEALLRACEQRLALIENTRTAALEQSIDGRYPNLPYFHDRERAVYAFGVALLNELLQPGAAQDQLFP
jgi:hypothetical protein